MNKSSSFLPDQHWMFHSYCWQKSSSFPQSQTIDERTKPLKTWSNHTHKNTSRSDTDKGNHWKKWKRTDGLHFLLASLSLSWDKFRDCKCRFKTSSQVLRDTTRSQGFEKSKTITTQECSKLCWFWANFKSSKCSGSPSVCQTWIRVTGKSVQLCVRTMADFQKNNILLFTTINIVCININICIV
jgi:hypothetical protein